MKNGIPSDLQALLAQIDAEQFDYADRQRNIESMQGWIDRGDFDMAQHSAKTVIGRQRQLQQAAQLGLPGDLQAMLAQIDAEQFDYADRQRNIESMQGWIDRGDFDMARHAAKTVIERQRQLQQAAQRGLPGDLQAMLAQIDTERFDYADRPRNIESMQGWIDRGDFDMARHSAKTVIERQRQLQQAAQRGLPGDLQAMFAQIDTERFDYADRQRNIESMQGWIDRGDFDMARHAAKTVIERQHQLQQAAQRGLPGDLQAMLAQIDTERFDYADRQRNIESMQGWIDRGDFDMARHAAKTVIERQQNLRSANTSDEMKP
jgi:glycyl-tRNA synthetase (class II)